MTEVSKYRQPLMGSYGELAQWNCQWPGCEFDTLDEAAWHEHIDPVSGAHRDPLGLPGELPRPLGADERAELDELRAFKAATEAAQAEAPPKGGKTKEG